MTVYIGEPGSDDIATFLPLGYLNSLDWEPMDCELPKWDAPLLGEQSFEVTIDFIDRSLMSILLGLDLNLHNEIVCDFTGIVSYGCSHCAKLPWEPEGGIQWD